MNKEQGKLMERKFEKLSDANKIRYNLGRIIHNQDWIYFQMVIFGAVIVGLILISPFLIRYVGIGRIVLYALMGVLIMFIAFVFTFVELHRLIKFNKKLEKFLNKKSKK